jgi:16S rRNA (cytidine1402-2'-O)-methyltransferase
VAADASALESMRAGGTLFLVPSTLGDGEPGDVLPEPVLKTIRGLDSFIAEEARSARAFLRRVGLARQLAAVRIDVLNEHTDARELPRLLEPALNGGRVGLLSEAGYPAIADPGAELVALAHQQGLPVVPLVGPCSLLLALAASGLNGQSFCVHGYLPVEADARAARIRELQARSRNDASAQLFIEAPYRNNQLLAALLETCDPDTRLCLATELTLPTASIRTLSVAAWRAKAPDLNRRPTVFVLQAGVRVPVSATAETHPDAPAPRRLRRRSGARSARPGSRGA